MTFYFCILVPYDEKEIIFDWVFIESFNFSFFGISGWGIDLECCEIERFALETNRNHSAISEIAPKHGISDSFVDYEGYTTFSKGFLPRVVDIMVI